ncbi:Gfo/Idh/MocA family oxidoreductase [Opitutaceae bacterium]|jgi:glucose-fructose oxidoreductase|nr:Gfo/Idh/MocA family oxidoreductase [Opitutaceae bacterium]
MIKMRRMSATPLPPISRRHFIGTSAMGAAGLSLGLQASPRDLLPQGRKLGIALVGMGAYAGRQLAPALKQTELCELRGVVTGDPAGKGQRFASEYGFSEKNIFDYETMHRIADNPEIDIVYVVTPPGLHKRDVLVAAGAGKHVICEKPMAVSVAECDEMIAACNKAEVRFSIGYRLHFHPYHQRVKEIAAHGEWEAAPVMTGGFAYRQGDRRTWRMDKALGGGGQLMNVGIYVLQSALMAKGEMMPTTILAHEEPKSRPELFNEVEDTIRFQLDWADGSRLEGVSSGDFGQNDFIATTPHKNVEIGPAYSYGGLRMSEDGKAFAPLNGFNQQAHQMDGFAAAILQDEPSTVPAAMGRRDIVLTSAIYESAASGKPVKVS